MEKEKFNFNIVIPVYNSATTISPLVQTLIQEYAPHDMQIVLVEDGGQDQSGAIIMDLARKFPGQVISLRLSKNFGEHHAVMAGLNHCRHDYAIIIDDDFQNPPSEIIKLLRAAQLGNHDVVYGIYSEKKHHFFRNLGSRVNGLMATYLIGKPKDLYLSSFKCISRFTYQEITKYRGPYPYIDGLILRVTRNVKSVLVDHRARSVGKSNYTLKKLVLLFMNMAFNFSPIPLRLIAILGAIFFVIGGTLSLMFCIEKFLNPELKIGWASIIVAILSLGGVQLLFLGIIGEYLGRLFLLNNLTPQFVVRETSSMETNQTHLPYPAPAPAPAPEERPAIIQVNQ